MKKTLVALAVAAMAASSAASAITVYEQDGTKIELSGSLRMYLGRMSDDQRGDLVNDGSRLKIRATHDLGNGLSAFAGYQLRFEKDSAKNKQAGSKSTWGDPTTRELFVGFAAKDVGALSFGRHTINADDFLNDSAYYMSASASPLTTRSDKSVKFRSAEWNGFSFGLDYLFGNPDKNNAAYGDYKNGYSGVLFYNYDIDQEQSLSAALLYTQERYEGLGTATGMKNTQWGAHLGYVYGPADIAVSYVNYRNTDVGSGYIGRGELVEDLALTGKTKGNYILLDAGYRVIPESRAYFQWQRLDAKQSSEDYTAAIRNYYTVGIDYRFNKNVVPYVEYTHIRTKYAADYQSNDDKDNVFGVGLRVHF
ncbi:porin [Pasteurellaceae bacterium LIM206]|nr:porin [Pasteurellaceae bacterium LIM206]